MLEPVIGVALGHLINGESDRINEPKLQDALKDLLGGNFNMEVPQDRKSTFAPQIIFKRQKDIFDIDRKIISIFVSDVTDNFQCVMRNAQCVMILEFYFSDESDRIFYGVAKSCNVPLVTGNLKPFFKDNCIYSRLVANVA